MKHSLNKNRKAILIVTALTCLIAIDVVTSRIQGVTTYLPPVDSLIFESGDADIDGYTAASIKTHISIVKSDYPGLANPKPDTAALTDADLRAMVLKAILLDKHYGTNIPELKYKINAKGANAWVSIMPNLNALPGVRFMPGDGTDPRILRAVLDYIADSTTAKRISLLAGGSYANYSDEFGIFNTEEFTTVNGATTTIARWCTIYPELDSHFTLKAMMDAIQSRHPTKTLECINTNYNEILSGGTPYNELDSASRIGKLPVLYAVPTNGNPYGIGALPTSNTLSDSDRYNPTDAVRNCDILVNVPVMKTTSGTEINCQFKNYVGSVSRAVYSTGVGYPQGRATSLNALDHDVMCYTALNLFSFHPTDYAIIDVTASLEGPGSHPWSSRTAWLKRNFVMAGGDPVALEAAACATMRLNPNDMDLLRWAVVKGYGTSDLRRIAMVGTPLTEVQVDFIPDLGENSIYQFPGFNTVHYLGRACRRWLLNGPYTAADNSVEHLPEAAADPRPGDTINGLTWNACYSPANIVDLTAAVPASGTNSVVYAFAQIYSETDQSGKLYAGGVRDMRVYINGDKVADTTGLTAYSDIAIVKDITLHRGDNRILVKVRRTGTICQFSLALVTDGLATTRTTYVPHASSGRALGAQKTFTADMKKALFGGRTLPGTFYHLGQSDPIAVEAGAAAGLKAPVLLQNSPNPFNTSTRIAFAVPGNKASASLAVYDAAGRKVRTLFSGQPGSRLLAVDWNGMADNGSRVSGGFYFCKLTSGRHSIVRRMAYLR